MIASKNPYTHSSIFTKTKTPQRGVFVKTFLVLPLSQNKPLVQKKAKLNFKDYAPQTTERVVRTVDSFAAPDESTHRPELAVVGLFKETIAAHPAAVS